MTNLFGQQPWARRGEAAAAVASAAMPVGAITAYWGTAAPTGWLICDGSTFSSTQYPALTALLGGTTLPNLKGRVIAGYDAAQTEFDTMGETGGAKTVALVTGNLPAHTHGLNGHNHGGATPSGGGSAHHHGPGVGADQFAVKVGSSTLGLAAPGDGQATYSATTADENSHTHSTTIAGDNGSTTNGGFAGTAVANLPPYMALSWIIKAG